MSNYEITCFSCPADGICTGSVILQAAGEKGPKYLFNAPEGFARLVLEHKVRPSQHLRATFLTQLQPHAAGGLPGLIMRLRQDGHEELQVHGPSGLAANLNGLRHFVQWKHPRVFANEHMQWDDPQVYEDGHVHVAALQQGGLAWPCPTWLQPTGHQGTTAQTARPDTTANGTDTLDADASDNSQADQKTVIDPDVERVDSSDDSSHMSDDSSAGHDAGNEAAEVAAPVTNGKVCPSPGRDRSNSSSSSSSEDNEADSSSDSSSCGVLSDGGAATSDSDSSPNDTDVKQQAAFEKLDSLFANSGPSGSVSTHLAALDLLKRGSMAKPKAAPRRGADSKSARSVMAARLKPQSEQPLLKQQQRPPKQQQQQQLQQRRQAMTADSSSKAKSGDSVLPDGGKPSRGATLATENGGKELQQAEWVQMQDGGNPLYLRQRQGLSGKGPKDRAGLGIWGYLVHFKATGLLLLLVDCPTVHAVAAIARHPVFHYLKQQDSRLNDLVYSLTAEAATKHGLKQLLRAMQPYHVRQLITVPTPACSAVERVSGVVHLTSPKISSRRAYAQWMKSFPGQQVVLNGGTQHVFQSALRATAKLHLLSPALFPLPVGAKCLPVQLLAAEAGRDGSEAASLAATTSASASGPIAKAVSGKRAKQAKQDVSSAKHIAVPAALLPEPEPADLPSSHLQQAPSDSDVPTRPTDQTTADGCGGKGLLETAGSKGGKGVKPQAANQRGKALVVGPVTRISGGSTGLSIVPGEFSEPVPPSLGGVQQELLASKPAFASFVKQLKASHPAFFGKAQPPQAAPQQHRVSPAEDASPALNLPTGLSRQIQPPGLMQNASPRPDEKMCMANGHRSHAQGAWAGHYSGSHHYDTPGLPRMTTQPQGSHMGAFPSMPQMPAPPPGYALVPIASDGSLQYPGAIVNPQLGGNRWHSHQDAGCSSSSMYSQQQVQYPIASSVSWPPPSLADSHGHHQQHQMSGFSVDGTFHQHYWQPQQQQQHQHQQQPVGSGHNRKRKLTGDQAVTLDGNGEGAGSIGGSDSCMPDSNAGAAAQLRRKLQIAVPQGSSQSSQPNPQLRPVSPQLGSTQAVSQLASECKTVVLSQESKHGQAASNNHASPSGGPGLNDKTVSRTGTRPVQSSSSAGETTREGHDGPHGLDCVRPDDRTQVNFLGTGSAEPSKYRGASAIHIRLHSGWGLLLDAGEGAWGSLVRMYGHKAACDQVNSLTLVWISHKHADHMLGLPGILAARHASCPPLLVIGPSEAAKWLSEISAAQQLRYRFMHSSQLNRMSQQQQQQHEVLQHTGLESLTSVPVNHCYDAYGLVVLHKDGWKLVYSGDTRPCRALQDAGKSCTLLIHEATFAPELIDHAKAKKHSTTEEALQVAAAMGANRTVLTHFSQRYSKAPVELRSSQGPESAMIAFDGMNLPLTLLPDLPQLAQGVALAFAEDALVEGDDTIVD